MNLEELKATARWEALGSMLRAMASPEKTQDLMAQIATQSDQSLDQQARQAGVPEDQWPLHRAMMRQEPNVFMQGLKVVDGLLKPGDIILMTNPSSMKLVKGQQIRYYKEARSSHVALVHADFVCIDAMPKAGVTNRIVSKLLAPASDDWRVIRCNRISDVDAVVAACAYYLAQPYLFLPSKLSAPSYTYCSELVRKVYARCGVTDVGISNGYVIAPAHFDMLADGLVGQPHWEDVTEKVRPAVNFCREYPALIDIAVRFFIEGLQLNRKRYEERAEWLRDITQQERSGKITKQKAAELRGIIEKIEDKANFKYWDVRRSHANAAPSGQADGASKPTSGDNS